MTSKSLSRASLATSLGVGWVLLAAIVFLIASIPTSTQVQALLGITAVALVLLAKPFAKNRKLARLIMLAVASTLILRYWIWRLTDTLPAIDAPISLSVALILFLIETYAIAIFFLTAFINSDPIEHSLPPQVRVKDLPKVDVLVPSYNEPSEMLSVTLSAAKQIIYPPEKLRVVLCDDGGTDERCTHSDPVIAAKARARRAELQELCRDLGVLYSTRARNENAKAGNMSAALARIDGDLVAVFDADHVPSRDFLARTVGYFVQNPRLFLVQTPHFFLNLDPIQRNLGMARACPTENEMFYTNIHRGLDRWRGAFFCGSAAVLRRAALDEVGGFSGETITEDAETALDIHARGWESLYVNRAMIAGLQPETFATFIQQRGRWATGMVQMLLLKNPLLRSGLTLQQRLCYLNSMSFWLFPLVRMGFLIIPLFYLFFGLEIFVATGEEFLVYTVSYLIVSFLVQNALFGRVRWPLISEVYEVAQAPYLGTQIIKTILRPRAAKFAVTAKDETLSESLISPIFLPLLVLFLLLTAGLVAAGIRWVLFPGDHTTIAVVGGWAVFNFLLAGLALGSVCEKQQRRGVPRLPLKAPGTISFMDNAHPDGSAKLYDAMILDGATSGARVKLLPSVTENTVTADPSAIARDLKEGGLIALRPSFPRNPALEADIMAELRAVSRGPEGVMLGLHFLPQQTAAARAAAAYLLFSDSEVWRRMREDDTRAKGLVAGLLYVLWLSLRTIPHAIGQILREPARRRRRKDDMSDDKAPVHILAFGNDFEANTGAPTPKPVQREAQQRDGLDFILKEDVAR